MRVIALLVWASLLLACSREQAAVDPATTAAPAPTSQPTVTAPADTGWVLHGNDTGEQRYSALDQVNRDTVGQLGLAWYFDLDTRRGVEATPLVVDGV
ncbi:MAG: PQQ-dependent dehydrogenase, methanol/ethanol family, partial [Halioglobus sp.]